MRPLSLLTPLFLAMPLLAGTPDDGQSIAELRTAAEQGHADAQAHLSWAYHTGVGVKTDAAEAVKWEQLAAKNGQASAQYYLGSDYEFGLGGLPKDAAQAATWYRRAAEQNHPIAQSRLGDLYAEGRGVPRDDYEALRWYARAAIQNDSGGYLGLGRMYAAGRGVPKDEEKALKSFERAADLETSIAFAAVGLEAGMSPSLKRDYGLSLAPERTPPSSGAVVERDKLAAILRARQPQPSAVPPAKAEEFCPRLEAMMAAAMTNFVAIRGKGDEENGWEATERLPGMRWCTIESAGSADDARPFKLHCYVAYDVDAASAAGSREGTSQLVSRCLGASWRATAPPPSEYRSTVFFDDPKSPLQLEIFQEISGRSKYSVDLTIAAPLPPLSIVWSRADGAAGLDSPVDFKSEKAGAGNVVHAFAELLGADLFIDLELKGKVTFDRKNVPLHEALDAVCSQISCTWSLNRSHSRPELYVERRAAAMDR